jgi:hypothetical protein
MYFRIFTMADQLQKITYRRTKTSNGSLVNIQKRTYEYNSIGYATRMKLTDGSNEGQKYYYAQ